MVPFQSRHYPETADKDFTFIRNYLKSQGAETISEPDGPGLPWTFKYRDCKIIAWQHHTPDSEVSVYQTQLKIVHNDSRLIQKVIEELDEEIIE
jgi:hypothetical protein